MSICRHKAGVVPKNYDKEAHKKNLDAHSENQPTTVDFSNAEMQPLGGERRADRECQ